MEKRKLAAKTGTECKNILLRTLWMLALNLGHQRGAQKPCDPAETQMTPIIKLSEN